MDLLTSKVFYKLIRRLGRSEVPSAALMQAIRGSGYLTTIRMLSLVPRGQWASAMIAFEGRKRSDGRFAIPLRGGHVANLRRQTTDGDVFWEVFVKGAYRLPSPSTSDRDPLTILDLGANAGLTSLYFLMRFPAARIIAVEPDPDNAAMARLNVSPYADRAMVLNAAVSSEDGLVRVCMGEYGTGKSAMSVRPTVAGDAEAVEALSMKTLMNRFDIARIDILKVDVEGAETSLLLGDRTWIDRTRVLAIELHNKDAERAFATQMRPTEWQISQIGNTRVAVRRGQS
jgi:FkbM family methyltransferase